MKLTTDELAQWAGDMAQNVISELAAADAAIDLMMHDESVSLETRGKLSLLIEQLRYAAGPAKQFIMLSRPHGEISFVDLNEFLSDLSRLFRLLLQPNIDFQMQLATDLWTVRVNETSFRDALFTLFVKARNAMPSGGKLLFRATNVDEVTSQEISGLHLSGDHVLVEITDNGVGIPPAYLERIFDPFVITKAPVDGFGIAKASWAIKDANGHISVKSEVGKGTTFHVLVPRYVPIR